MEEQVRAAAEHKLGVANQSITAGFFDNNTRLVKSMLTSYDVEINDVYLMFSAESFAHDHSAEDRREYLESLLRECKKEEAAPVLGDDALNDLIARK